MFRICFNVKSQWTKKIEVFSQGASDSNNLRYETLYIGNYEYVNISSVTISCMPVMQRHLVMFIFVLTHAY